MLAQEGCERMHLARRAMQGQHAGGGRTAERGLDAEFLLGGGEQRIVAAGKARAHLAEGGGPAIGGDAVEHEARGLALGSAPGRGAGGDEIGLRAQDYAILDHLEAVRGERRAGRGDVDDQLGGAGGGRAFGRAGALDDAVIDDPVLGEEAARQIDVFGRDPHAAVVLEAERGRDIVEVGHAAHVDPGLRHGDDHIGEAEAERLDQHHAFIRLRDRLAHQILAGDPEMHRACRELLGDLLRREKRDFDAGQSGDRAAILARPARLRQREPGAGEEGLRILHQAALRRHGDDERAHRPLPRATSRSIHTASPTAGIGSAQPSRANSPS